MSVQAMAWVLDDAPGLTAHLFGTLMALANQADTAGRNAWPSQDTIARQARKTARSVRSDLAALEELGLIRPGDQRVVGHIRADHRPVVWDLAMSFERAEADDRKSTTGGGAPAGSVASPRPEVQRHTTGSPLPPTRTTNPTDNPQTPTGSGARSRAPRAARLPEDWKPSPELTQWALDEYPEFTADRGRVELAKFIDYWHARGGAGARKVDWAATFRNWWHRAAEEWERHNRRSPTDPRQAATNDRRARQMARAQAREAGYETNGSGGPLPQGRGVLPAAAHG